MLDPPKPVHEALHEQQEWLRVTLSSIGDGVIVRHERRGHPPQPGASPDRLAAEEPPAPARTRVPDQLRRNTRGDRNPARRALREGVVGPRTTRCSSLRRHRTAHRRQRRADSRCDRAIAGVVLVFRRDRAQAARPAGPGRARLRGQHSGDDARAIPRPRPGAADPDRESFLLRELPGHPGSDAGPASVRPGERTMGRPPPAGTARRRPAPESLVRSLRGRNRISEPRTAHDVAQCPPDCPPNHSESIRSRTRTSPTARRSRRICKFQTRYRRHSRRPRTASLRRRERAILESNCS